MKHAVHIDRENSGKFPSIGQSAGELDHCRHLARREMHRRCRTLKMQFMPPSLAHIGELFFDLLYGKLRELRRGEDGRKSVALCPIRAGSKSTARPQKSE